MPTDIGEIRRANLRRLRGDKRGAQSDLARKLDMTESQLSQLIGKTPSKVLGSALARKLERKLNLTRGWLDQEHYPATSGNAHIIKAVDGLTLEQKRAVLALLESFKK